MQTGQIFTAVHTFQIYIDIHIHGGSQWGRKPGNDNTKSTVVLVSGNFWNFHHSEASRHIAKKDNCRTDYIQLFN